MQNLRAKIVGSMGESSFGSRAVKKLRLQLLKPEQIVGNLPANGIIYDLGCGFGLCSIAAAFNPEAVVTGYDIDESRIRNNQAMFAQFSNLSFEVADIFNFEPESLADGIMIIDSLHYFDEASQTEIINSLWKHLRPGGLLIIRDPVRDGSLKFKWNQFHEKTLVEVTKWTKTKSAKNWFLDRSQWSALFSQLDDCTVLKQFACHTYLPYNDHLFVLEKSAERQQP